jgi:hypothetical protein
MRVMRLLEINWNPPDRQLRQFGVVAAVALPLFGWLCTATPGRGFLLSGLAITGLTLAIVGMVRPRLLRPVFVTLCLIALPIGLVVNEIILLVLYGGVFTPMALVFRLTGRDALQRAFDRRAPTYWQPKVQPVTVRQYFRQY